MLSADEQPSSVFLRTLAAARLEMCAYADVSVALQCTVGGRWLIK